MNSPRQIEIPHGDEVTTAPQRQALETMSQNLVEKLNAMVAEQEQRARDFAAHQHSLSSLPSYTLPEIAQENPPQVPVPRPPKPAIATSAPPADAYGKQEASIAGPTITNGPRLPKVPPVVRESRPNKNTVNSPVPHREYKMPTIIRDPESEEQKGTIGAGTISVIIFIIFVLLMHGCE